MQLGEIIVLGLAMIIPLLQIFVGLFSLWLEIRRMDYFTDENINQENFRFLKSKIFYFRLQIMILIVLILLSWLKFWIYEVILGLFYILLTIIVLYKYHQMYKRWKIKIENL